MGKRIITTENLEEDVKIENHLRPQLLSDYIGQEKMGIRDRLYNGLVKENPTFVLMLGMCPTLAVTTSAINGVDVYKRQQLGHQRPRI